MFKKLLALFSLFTLLLTPFVVAVETGGQATLEAGLVHRAKVLPVGNNADDIAVSSILSLVKGKRAEDLMQLCGDRERLKSRLRSLVKYDLCQGVGAVLDSCYYANSVCTDLRDNSGCSLSSQETLSRCIDAGKAQAVENRASISTFEAALSGRCEQACDEGIRIRGLKPSSAIQRECSAVGFEYRSLGPYAACVSTGENPNLPITFEQAEETGVEFPEEELGAAPEPQEDEIFPMEEELGDELSIEDSETLVEVEEAGDEYVESEADESLTITTVCAPAITSCPKGYNLTRSVVGGCTVNQCVNVTTLPTTALCTDDGDNGNNPGVRGTTIAISASNVRTEKTDACKSATSLLEYYCTGTTLTTSAISCPNGCTNGVCPTTTSPASTTTSVNASSNTTIVPTGISTTISTVTYNCTDTDGGVAPIVQGTVTVTPSTTSATTSADYCYNSTRLIEYSCTSGTASKATVTGVTCSSATSCLNGACVSNFVGTSGTTSSKNSTTTTTSSSSTSSGAVTYSCVDSDSGVTSSTAGTVTIAPSTGSPVSRPDSCANSTHVFEYSCANSTASTATRTSVACTAGQCSTGACVASAPAVAPTPTVVTYNCTDSDSGQIAGTAGNVTVTPSIGSATTSLDTCASSTTVTEYSCTNSTSPSASSKTLTCLSGQACSSGRCASSTSKTITSKLVTPLTIKIIAVPSVLSAFLVGDDDSVVDAPGVSAASESCVDNCKALLRAEVWGSYGDENIAKECKKEVNGNAGLVKQFCEQGDSEEVYNECSAYVESTCSLAVPAFDKCKELSRDKEKVIDLLADAVEDKCEAVKLGLVESSVDWSKLSPSSAVVGQGAEETAIKSRVNIEKSLKSNIFDEASRIVCLRYGAEKEAAAKCKNSVDKIKASIDILEQLKAQSDEADQAPIDAVIDKLKPQLNEWQGRCEVKDKKAAGICGGTI